MCHKCDNRICINPDHLFLGTDKDNMEDAAQKGRVRHGERHPYAKFTATDARKMRALVAAGASYADVWRRYPGSSYHTVYCIASGRSRPKG